MRAWSSTFTCAAITLAACAMHVGCGGASSVTRVEHGRVEVGFAVAPSAYAESLREAIARETASNPQVQATPINAAPGDAFHARVAAAKVVDRAQDAGRCAPLRVSGASLSPAAVDEALVRGDVARAKRRATCVAMHDAELSLRAWYFGNVTYAVSIAGARIAAEPSWGGRVVVVGGVKLLRPYGSLGDALLAWALSIRGDDDAAKRVSGSVARESGDHVLRGLLRGTAAVE